jgi:hypothetical protein
MIDLGLAAKPRPVVILSVQFRANEKAVVTRGIKSNASRPPNDALMLR